MSLSAAGDPVLLWFHGKGKALESEKSGSDSTFATTWSHDLGITLPLCISVIL